MIEANTASTSIIRRSAIAALNSTRLISSVKFDLIYVGFYGYYLIHWVRALSKAPVIFDPFVSNFETLIEDRQKGSPKSILAGVARSLDSSSFHKASSILTDTTVHGDYFSKTYKIDRELFSRVFVSCDEKLFVPGQVIPETDEILFYGSYQPLHGISTIIHAASQLKGFRNIIFRIIGDSPEKPKYVALAKAMGASNIIFQPSVPITDLPYYIARAKICLGGPLGGSLKSQRVITGKTFQCLAMGRPIIVGDNLANPELLEHGRDAYFCHMDDPTSLAEGIKYLISNDFRRKEIALNARQTFLEKASLKVISNTMAELISSLL